VAPIDIYHVPLPISLPFQLLRLVSFSTYSTLNNIATVKSTLEVIQGH